MKKNDVFTFTAPNGVEVQAVVIAVIKSEVKEIPDCGVIEDITTFLCYAQNRLFTFIETDSSYEVEYEEYAHSIHSEYGKILADYAILPDYDELLARYNDIEVAQAETANGM